MTVHSQYAPGYPCPTQSLCKTEVAHLRCDDLGNYAWSVASMRAHRHFRCLNLAKHPEPLCFVCKSSSQLTWEGFVSGCLFICRCNL